MKTWISSAISVMLLTPQVYAKGSVDATQLQIVALNTNVKCNRTFFQGSSHFPNTIFAMPRVVQGAGPDNKRSIEIIPTADGSYLMYVRLFFPAKDSYLKSGTTSSAVIDRDACNFDEVRESINSTITDPNKLVKTISPMPLTSIEVSLPGVKEVARMGVSEGDDSADILDYLGKSMNFIFKIDETEKDFVESQVVTLDGIPMQVKFRFQARSRDGSVNVTINAAQLKANFLAQAKGEVYLADADVAVALRAAMDSSAVSIVSEAGTSENSEATITKIVDKILSEVSLAPEVVKKDKKKKDKDAEEEEEADEDDKKDEKVADDASEEEETKISDFKSKEGRVAVKAIAEVISKVSKKSFSYDQVSAPESATAQTEIALRANRIKDANVTEVAIQAGYQDPSAGIPLKEGQTIAISPAFSYVERLDYKEHKTFITTGMISDLDLAQYFEEITSSNMSIASEPVNGIPMAIGRWHTFGVPNPGSYRWLRIERTAVRTRESSHNYQSSIEELQRIPVAIGFTGLGDRYQLQLAKLIGENNWWKARFDSVSGRLMITAKKDLGRLVFREFMKGPENIEKAPIVSDEIIMQKESLMGNISEYKRVKISEDPRTITKQRTIVLYLSRPLSDQANADVEAMTNPEILKSKSVFSVRGILEWIKKYAPPVPPQP